MTLKEIIDKIGLKTIPTINYYTTFDNCDGHPIENFFTGIAAYENGELVSVDGNSYDINEKIIKYDLDTDYGEPILCVWYESKWMQG